MNILVLEKIKSRGYWHVVMRPRVFVAERVPTLADCQKLVERNQIRYRGWYFPHIDIQNVRRGLDYIEQATTTLGGINEIWRLYQSGQFAFFKGLREDWLKEDTGLPSQLKPNIGPEAGLEILATLYQLSEVYEFAARLAQVGVFGDTLNLMIDLVRTNKRQLFFWTEGRSLWDSYICNAPQLPKQRVFNVDDFIAHARDYSLEHFLWLMERFGFDAPMGVFKRDQEKFFQGRF